MPMRPGSCNREERMMKSGRNCDHLDTINRKVLDFDVEKFGSTCLKYCFSVYACLVCGQSFHGSSPNRRSQAYVHSYRRGHYVYINMKTKKFYCLADGCEINHPSLDDIRQALNPRFSRDEVLQLDRNVQWSKALDGSDYRPGMVGLRNIMENDFVNVTIQSLMRVTPLRNFFLVPENYIHSKSVVVQRFGELARKIWHSRNFKGQVSLFEFLEAIKRKKLVQSDPVEFTSWLLKILHSRLQNSETKRSIISDCFKGEFQVADDDKSRKPFLMLGLDLPASPDSMDSNIIPEVPLFDILKESPRVTKHPQYLILHMRRFTKNILYVEDKNPTLVNFPLKNLELKDYIIPSLSRPSKYDLIANIVHDDGRPSSSYSIFVQQKSEQLWYQIQDLHVAETLPQTVASSEAYMLIY